LTGQAELFDVGTPTGHAGYSWQRHAPRQNGYSVGGWFDLLRDGEPTGWRVQHCGQGFGTHRPWYIIAPWGGILGQFAEATRNGRPVLNCWKHVRPAQQLAEDSDRYLFREGPRP
jgi:hypothetical protein